MLVFKRAFLHGKPFFHAIENIAILTSELRTQKSRASSEGSGEATFFIGEGNDETEKSFKYRGVGL